MSQAQSDVASAEAPSNGQQLFLRYFTAILIDLVVLNLFAEYWEHVVVDSFTISLLTAVLLQILLKLTLALEHRVGEYYKARSFVGVRVLRILSAWLILFGSKFVMLAVIDRAFGDDMYFGGPFHGVVVFIAVVVAMLLAEELMVRFYRRLA